MICCVKEYSIEEVMEGQYKMSVETRILFTDLDGTLLNDHNCLIFIAAVNAET